MVDESATEREIKSWLVARRRYVLAVIDAVLVLISLMLSYFVVSLDAEGWSVKYAGQFVRLAPFVVVTQVALFAIFHLYRGLLRYAGLTELRVIIVLGRIEVGLFAGPLNQNTNALAQEPTTELGTDLLLDR